MNKGGKAAGLERLVEGGFAVPRFFVCDLDWSASRILETADIRLRGAGSFAVRSSAENEDSSSHSLAGRFYTGINVARASLPDEYRKVRDSYQGAPGAVIVQEFIEGEVSGVLFTDAGGLMIINATIGICQPVVSGEACDEYTCTKDGAVVHRFVATRKKIVRAARGTLTPDETDEEALDSSRIERLTRLARALESHFGAPQDVEWCFKGASLFVLQSRPITRSIRPAMVEYFDSANIAESYSGIVLPLTSSFAALVYAQVYKDLLRMSGVSRKKLEDHTEVFDNLLAFFYGRMYYTMNNWYRMAEFVPGYRRNKRNFELMITSNVSAEVATVIRPSFALRLLYPAILMLKILTFPFVANRFRSSVQRHLHRLRELDFDRLSYAECIALFTELNHVLLRRWYVTLENDFFVMTYLGILKKLIPEQDLQQALIFPSKATEQVAALAQLSAAMHSDKRLALAITTGDMSAFDAALAEDAPRQALLREYVQVFGGRFANELKLESVGIDEDRAKLLAVLRAYRTHVVAKSATPTLPRLRLTRMHAARFALRGFKNYASRREDFRLLRSNTFAMVRRLARRMGTLLSRDAIIEHVDDVFYLHMDELFDHAALTNRALRARIAERKLMYASFADITPPAHFSTLNRRPPASQTSEAHDMLVGRPASPGIARGKVRVFREFAMPEEIDFDIIVTSHTDPGWTPLIALSKGLIIEHGGVLSHASIVARELGIPAVIGASEATALLRDGEVVEIDGSTGAIRTLI